MLGYYFEDFAEGQEFLSDRRTITAADITNFATMTGSFSPLFFDREYVTKLYGAPIAPGHLTLSFALGLFEPMVRGTIIALVDIERARFLRPLIVDTTIEVQTRVVGTRARGPDAGLVTLEHKVVDSSEDVFLEFSRRILVKRRAPPRDA